METDILAIDHMIFGIERFAISEASWNLYQGDDGIWEFVVNVRTNKALNRWPELVDLVHAEPHFESTAIIQPDDLDIFAGKVIQQARGYDYEREENISNFYYCAHESIEDLRVELHEVTDDGIDATLTGSVLINGDNGTDPDSKISLRTIFKRNRELRRGVT